MVEEERDNATTITKQFFYTQPSIFLQPPCTCIKLYFIFLGIVVSHRNIIKCVTVRVFVFTGLDTGLLDYWTGNIKLLKVNSKI